MVQMFGPDQAVRDTSGNHDWAKPFTWYAMGVRAKPHGQALRAPSLLPARLQLCMLAVV